MFNRNYIWGGRGGGCKQNRLNTTSQILKKRNINWGNITCMAHSNSSHTALQFIYDLAILRPVSGDTMETDSAHYLQVLLIFMLQNPK
jgi:hypothetical protein